MDPTSPRWWQQSVVYQIYPRSFCDSNGDGVGDIPGITLKLDYLKELGADIVWLSPVYASPNDDNGYDISDYRAILPEFGTMADFDDMLAGMNARGIRLMMDLVVNHSSDEHDWFRQARASRDSPLHGYYIWSDPVDGREPNNWESIFGGSAWAWNEATGEYFLHSFSRRQPDLNWENPKLRQEVHALMRFWLDKGVAGFRMDVINLISKRRNADGRLPDAPVTRPGFLQSGFEYIANGPRLLDFLQEMRSEVLDHYDCITVGECPGVTPALARRLTDAKSGVLNMVFQFEHMELDTLPGQTKWAWKTLELRDLKRSLSDWQTGLAEVGWNSLYLGNHDQPRPVSRFACDEEWRVPSAKMLATLLHGMRGTPFVYQGEELGLTNYPFEHISQCRDIETLRMYDEAVRVQGESSEKVMAAVRRKGRDNARTPMQWSAETQAGFSTGEPWLAVHPNFAALNAHAAARDPESVMQHYRRLIALRRELPVFVHGRYELLWAEHEAVYAYRRTWGNQQLWVICNFTRDHTSLDAEALDLESAQMLLSNWPMPGSGWLRRAEGRLELRPYEAWLALIS